MPITRLYTGISLQTVDLFIPEESHETLSAALAGYGLYASKTHTLTCDGNWETLDDSPSTGTGLMLIKSSVGASIWVMSKGSGGNSLSKINSVPISGTTYLDARWGTVSGIQVKSSTNIGGDIEITWSFISC